MSPLLAEASAIGGNGPVISTNSGAVTVNIKGNQRLIAFTGSSTVAAVLPPVGGDNGALIGDIFIIVNNGTGNNVTVTASGASVLAVSTVGTNSTAFFIPISTTVWAGK